MNMQLHIVTNGERPREVYVLDYDKDTIPESSHPDDRTFNVSMDQVIVAMHAQGYFVTMLKRPDAKKIKPGRQKSGRVKVDTKENTEPPPD